MANEIQELKFQVGEAWKGVYSPSTAYGLANVVQDPTGLSIYRSLKSGNVGHPVTDASWWFRIIDLSSIKSESDRIAALNQTIAQDEALRVAAEELRQQHEAERVAAETQRNEAEQQRISAEQARVNAESARATAEQQRITAEQGRVSAESARVQAEQARVLAETLRANAEDQRAANEQNRVAAEQQRIERAEQDHQRAESDHATYVDSLGAFDISSYHAIDGVLAKYADITDAIGIGGANIPDTLRKGGMSVKFVQSSDNKYVQYRCMADEFSTDTNDWAIAEEGVYVENPEFVYVKTDKDDKILWAIKKDGDIYYGAGCPQQVKDYIEERISELSLDEYEDIVAFLSDYLGSDTTLKVIIDGINTSISNLSNTKVDKEEGKSLIDAEYASSQSAIENPEFLEVTTDSEDKVLEGIQKDGTKVIGGDLHVGGSSSIKGDAKILGNVEISGVLYKVVENSEYLAAWVDANSKVIFGLRADGKTYVGDADFLNDIENIKAFLANITNKNIDWDALSSITVDDNPEFIEVKTDEDGKILAGRTPDGAAFEKVGFNTPKVSIDGHTIENIEDQEGRTEITTDGEGKVISYRDSDGVKHEEVGIESPHIKVKDLEVTGNLLGFDANPTDWSAHKELQIPEPRCARVNFTGIEDIPQAKFVDAHGYMEFWDMQGNYFKKEVIMNAQGSSSMGQPKKNIAIDICNNNGWDDDDTFKLRIGNWVSQDSFHLKAYNTDFFKGVGVIGYKVADLVAKTYNEQVDRTWKQALLPDYTFGDSTVNGDQVNDKSIQAYNDARCMPDGFPCIVYLNGEFYGIYSWQIKKHRDNYHMNKSDAKNIHLDGVIDIASILNGVIQWSQFEIRNPKSLCYSTLHYDRDGKATFKYDADIPNGTDEIAGTDKNYDGDWVAGTYAIGKIVKKGKDYFISQVDNNDKEPVTQDASGNKNTAKDPDFKNKTKCGWINCTTSVKVKQYIIDLSNIKSLIDAEATDAGKKTIFETYFDVGNIVDYLLVQMIVGDPDSFRKNWQWTTWDGVKWYLNNYDKDFSFGANASGKYTMPAFMTYCYGDFTIAESRTFPVSCIWDYYRTELNARYIALRSNNIVYPNIIINLIKDWMDRIGEANYKKESAKWNPPCDKDMILGDGWKLYAYTSYNEYSHTPEYQESTVYNIGDKCKVRRDGDLQGLVFEATKNTSAYPIIEYGHRDSFYRISNWIRNRFMYLDEYFNYSEQ